MSKSETIRNRLLVINRLLKFWKLRSIISESAQHCTVNTQQYIYIATVRSSCSLLLLTMSDQQTDTVLPFI